MTLLEPYYSLYLQQLALHQNTEFKYVKDHRTKEEYILDLVKGWQAEDEFVLKLKELLPKDYEVTSTGNDKERVILAESKVKGDPDFQIQRPDGKKTHLELQYGTKDWQEINIKEHKGKRVLTSPLVIVHFIVPLNRYIVFTPSKFKNKTPIPNPKWRGKSCYAFKRSELVPITLEEVIALLVK